MKKVLTVFLVGIVSIGLSAACFAQTAGPTGQTGTLNQTPAKHKGGAYNEKVMAAALSEILPILNLTADQQTSIEALDGNTKDQLKQIRKDTKGDKEARRQKLMDLNKSYHQQLFTILTPDQRKQFVKEWKEFMKKWHAEHQKNKAGGTGTTPSGTPSANPSKP